MGKNKKRNKENIQSDGDESEPEETRCQLACKYFVRGLKRFVTFLFSHIGLLCLIVGYSLLGGIMFKAIELPNEKKIRQEAVETVHRYTDKIVDYTGSDSEDATALYRSLWNKKLHKVLKDYEQEIYKLTNGQDWDGQLADEPYQWTFANSLLYSVTIITTIGYGNVTPKTDAGKFISIIYASIGIPLTMLCLRNIGDILAGFFRIGYRLSCTNMTYQYIKLKRRRIKKRFVKRLQKKTQEIKHWANSKQSLVPSILHRQLSSRSDDSNESHEEIKNKDISPIEEVSSDEDDIIEVVNVSDPGDVRAKPEYRRCRSLSFHHNRRSSLEQHDVHRKLSVASIKPLPHLFERTMSTVNDLSIIPEDSTDFDISRPISPTVDVDKVRGSSTISDLSLHDFEEDDLRLKERLKSTRDFVPISVCLFLVTGYIIGGAILFTSWETGWDFLIGFYFCFITLSTIGFGDFVPGMVNANWDSDGRRVICIVYLVFGMALLAMSFHLIQEEVRHKFRKIAIKIGLVEEKLTKMLDKYDY